MEINDRILVVGAGGFVGGALAFVAPRTRVPANGIL